MNLTYGLTTTALLLLVGHWLPWPHKLHRLWAYVYGVTSIYLGIYIWLGWGLTFWTLCAFPVVGGMATGLAYGYDWLRNLIIRASLSDA